MLLEASKSNLNYPKEEFYSLRGSSQVGGFLAWSNGDVCFISVLSSSHYGCSSGWIFS